LCSDDRAQPNPGSEAGDDAAHLVASVLEIANYYDDICVCSR
jgi:hypothetical protein